MAKPKKNYKPKNTKATSLQLALAKGHRWLAMLKSGEVKSFREIAHHEKIDNSYVSRKSLQNNAGESLLG